MMLPNKTAWYLGAHLYKWTVFHFASMPT